MTLEPPNSCVVGVIIFTLNILFSYCLKNSQKDIWSLVLFFMKISVCFKLKTHKILVDFAVTLLWSKHCIYLKMENYNFHNDGLSVRGRVYVFNLKEYNIKMGSYQKYWSQSHGSPNAHNSSFLSPSFHSACVPWRRNELVFLTSVAHKPSASHQFCLFPLNPSSFPFSPGELHSNCHSASPAKG